jgi:hypothetical protein
MFRVLAVAAVAAAIASNCFGQAFTANLTGVVTDPKGAAIPNVSVKVVNVGNNETREVKTSGDGRYMFSQIAPGTYNLTAEQTGFKTFIRRGIALVANQSGEVDIAMQLGEVSQEVTISETAAQLDTQTANQSVDLGTQKVEDLPANMRNPFVLVQATAGVVSVRTGISTAPQDQNQNRFAMNGGRDESGLILEDGVPSTSGDWGGLIISPSIDSVQEMQVIRNSYEAQFGRSGGGVVSLVTKGGSNEYHGTGWEFLQNDVLNANSWANDRVGAKKTVFQSNQFGGNFGGPLWKSKKVYFFAGYEGLRQGAAATYTTSVPTVQERGGDFSDYLNAPSGSPSPIFDPSTTATAADGTFTRTQFPGNVIPQSRFDPIAVNVMKLYPLPNVAGVRYSNANNFFGAGKTIEIDDRIDARVDWAKSEKFTFFTRVSKAWEKDVAPQYFGHGADSNYNDLNPRDQAVIGATFVPTPTWVINVLLSAGRWREEQDSLSKGMNGTAVGFPASLVAGFGAQTIPEFLPSGYGQISNPRFLSFARPVNTLGANVAKELGAHSIKFGFLAEADQLNDTDVDSPTFNFNRGLTSGPAAATNSSNSGNSIASMLLGAGSSGSSPFNAAVAVQQLYYAWYVQDTWHIGKRLTLDYGIRYELQMPRTERYNRVNWFNFNAQSPLAQQTSLPLTGGLQFATSGNRGQWGVSEKDFAPRFGLAYKLTDKIVFRGGYGIFYLQTAGTGAVTDDGFSTSTAWVSTVGGDGIHPANLLSNPFPQGLLLPVGSASGLLQDVGQSVSAYQYPHPSGYTQNFSADFQVQISQRSVLQVGYSGSLGRKLLNGYGLNANQLPSQDLALGSQLTTQVANPFFGTITNGTLSGATVPYNQLLRPYPQFTAVNLSGDTPGASSSFNALVAQFNYQFAQGLSLLSQYQFSKAEDNASETQAWEIGDAARDYYNRKLDWSVSAHDVPQSWVTNLVWQVPVGKGKRFGGNLPKAADAVIGGWEVSSIVRIASGLPLQFTAPNTLSTYGFAVDRPNIVGNVTVPNPTPNLWFNTAAFAAPGTYQIGDAPRWFGNLRFGPTRNADMALIKNFFPAEHWRIQFRAEAFNISNTPQYGRPDTTFGDGNFGIITGTTNVGPRAVQFGLKIFY